MIISDHDILTSKKDVAFSNSSFCQPTVFPKIFFKENYLLKILSILYGDSAIFSHGLD